MVAAKAGNRRITARDIPCRLSSFRLAPCVNLRMAKPRASSLNLQPYALKLQQTLQELRIEAAERKQTLLEIQKAVLNNSSHMDSVNFRVFHSDDLEFMFRQYDGLFLGDACHSALNGRRLSFRLSPRMTRAGGLTASKTYRNIATGRSWEEFEISVSSHLLLQTFRGEERRIRVTGLPCESRLEAMQRIVEHELIHLCERLAWNHSSCRARRFQEIAHRLFGHLEHTHQLVTTAEVAQSSLGIRPGSHVSFIFEGRRLHGIVNRITKRVTVLVPDPCGRPYSDGRIYKRYYVPLAALIAVK